MNEDLMLSKSELAALDVLIDAMAAQKAAAAIADPAAWIGAAARVTWKVTKKTLQVAAHVTPVVVGAQVTQDPRFQQLAKELEGMSEPTLEQLMMLRSIQLER